MRTRRGGEAREETLSKRLCRDERPRRRSSILAPPRKVNGVPARLHNDMPAMAAWKLWSDISIAIMEGVAQRAGGRSVVTWLERPHLSWSSLAAGKPTVSLSKPGG